MDPFTEVRGSAGAVNHDPCRADPPPAPPVSLWPTGGPRGACAQQACSRAEAAGSRWPGIAAPLWLMLSWVGGWGEAGKTGPQKLHASPELCVVGQPSSTPQVLAQGMSGLA